MLVQHEVQLKIRFRVRVVMRTIIAPKDITLYLMYGMIKIVDKYCLHSVLT